MSWEDIAILEEIFSNLWEATEEERERYTREWVETLFDAGTINFEAEREASEEAESWAWEAYREEYPGP